MFKKILLPVLYTLVGMLLIANCVREIDYTDSEADANTVAISGGFSNTDGPHRLRMVRPDNYEGQFYRGLRNAKITLHDDLGNAYPYKEVVYFDQREYWLEGVKGEIGRTYWIEIEYNGTKMRSRAEKMMPPLPIDTVLFEARLVERLAQSGALTLKPFGFVYANTILPEILDDRCLRWEAEYMYINYDRPCPTPLDPNPRHQCFVRNFLGDLGVLGIANPRDFQPGSRIKTLCGERQIGVAFAERCAISVYQRTISEEAYEYWEKVAKTISPEGTVLDVPPGRITGNMEVVSGPKLDVLGWYEISSTAIGRTYRNRIDLPFDVSGFAVNPCYESNVGCFIGGETPCFDCRNQPYSTLEKPEWWQ